MYLPDAQLKELLIKSEVVTSDDVAKAEAVAKKSGSKLETAIVEIGALNEDQLGVIVAGHFNIPFVSLSKLSIPEDVAHIIPEKVARRVKAVAFARGGDGIKVALSDPSNKNVLTMVARKTGERALAYYASESEIEATISLYQKECKSFKAIKICGC
jgi:hypothetical protein